MFVFRRKLAFATIGGVLAFCVSRAAVTADGVAATGVPHERIKASRAVVGEFAAKLKAALVKSMEEDGPLGAVEVCHTLAPQIAAETSAKTGWRVGRTSLMTRNTANHPDAWEQHILTRFAARKAAGGDPATMESWAVVGEDGEKQFRYMKAIPTAPLCMTCHGTDVDPTLAARIDALYPEDRATGYHEGDIRGAFTISQPM